MKITIIYMRQHELCSARLKFSWCTNCLNNNHTYPMAAAKQPLTSCDMAFHESRFAHKSLLAGFVEYHPYIVSPSPKITPHVFDKVKIMAPVEQWHCANGVCMKGILAYSRGSGVRWGSLRNNWSQCGIGNSFVTHLAMLGTHGFLCWIPTQAPPRHHRRRTVIELMGHHSSYTRCHLRHPDDITFFRIIIPIKARLAF